MFVLGPLNLICQVRWLVGDWDGKFQIFKKNLIEKKNILK